MILNEGGNIWPEESSSFDQVIVPGLKAEVDKYLKDIGLQVYPMGSAATPTKGKISGDFDVLVDLDIVMHKFNSVDAKQARIDLEKYLQQRGLTTRRIAVTVHVLVPFKGAKYQVDIKVVKNAKAVALFHTHSLPANSPYKGVHKQMMLNALATSQGYLWSPDEGLYSRDDQGKKADFVSANVDDIAKTLIGPSASGKDLGSVESILDAIPDAARRAEVFDIAKNSRSWQAITPMQESVDFGSSEWFRKVLNTLS
jgi:hypothetical protein